MEMHLSLGECYAALGRDEDSISTLHEGLLEFGRFTNEHRNIPGPADSKAPIFRCQARPFVAYGDLLTAVDRELEAAEYYQAAERIMSQTRFVGDDDILEWEYEQCLRRIENLSLEEGQCVPSLEQKREAWAKKLELEICDSYRVNWYAFMGSDTPRYRGGEGGWAARILGSK